MLEISNAVNLALGAAGYHLTGKSIPLNLMWSVTDRCNSNCLYCDIPSRNSPELSTEEGLALISEAADSGCKRIGFWGGEPLIRKDLDILLNYAVKRNIWCTLDTNGRLLSERRELLNMLGAIAVSLDGPEDINDEIRGKGSYAAALKAIRLAVSQRVPVVIISVITELSLPYQKFMLKLAQREGAAIAFQPLHHSSQLSRNNQNLSPEDKSLRNLFKFLLYSSYNGAPVLNSRPWLRMMIHWKNYSIPRISAGPCLGGKLFANIDTDGSLAPCSLLAHLPERPKVQESGLMKAFANCPTHDCGSCLAPCYMDYSFMFNFHPLAILPWLKAVSTSRPITQFCKLNLKRNNHEKSF